MTDRNLNQAPYIVIKSSNWDAEYFGRWLLAADEASKLWVKAKTDFSFYNKVQRLEVITKLDFGFDALTFVAKLRKKLIVLPLRSDLGDAFAKR